MFLLLHFLVRRSSLKIFLLSLGNQKLDTNMQTFGKLRKQSGQNELLGPLWGFSFKSNSVNRFEMQQIELLQQLKFHSIKHEIGWYLLLTTVLFSQQEQAENWLNQLYFVWILSLLFSFSVAKEWRKPWNLNLKFWAIVRKACAFLSFSLLEWILLGKKTHFC